MKRLCPIHQRELTCEVCRMADLGRRTSKAKRAAVRANGKLGGRPRKGNRLTMKTITTTLCALLLLTGCQTASKAYTAIPAKGQTSAQLFEDTALCESTAQAYRDKHESGAMIGGGFLGMATNHNAYQREYVTCMTAKGYTFKD